jgi:hypothetical protein
MFNVQSYQIGDSAFIEFANKSFADVGKGELVSFKNIMAIAPLSIALRPVL